MLPDRIYHLALRGAWEAALERHEPYRRSTIDTSLEEEGFIHCSLPSQVQRVADRYYRDRGDVVLLTIDPSLVPDEIRVENLGGGEERYPHIYGPLPLEAVVDVTALRSDDEGRLVTGM